MRANIVGCQLYLSQYQCINSSSLFQLLTFSEYNVNIVVELDFAINIVHPEDIIDTGIIILMHAYHVDVIQGVRALEQLLVRLLHQFYCIL